MELALPSGSRHTQAVTTNLDAKLMRRGEQVNEEVIMADAVE